MKKVRKGGPAVVLSTLLLGSQGNQFSQAGGAFWTDILYKKNFPLDGQAGKWAKIILSASQFAWYPAINETPVPPSEASL